MITRTAVTDQRAEHRLITSAATTSPLSVALPGPGLSIADILRLLMRSKWIILAFLLIGLGASLVYVKLKTPIYEATVNLQIDPGRGSSLGLGELSSAGGYVDETGVIATQLLILKSQTVIFSALQSLPSEDQRQLLTLSDLPDFTHPDSIPPLQREGILGSIESRLKLRNIENTQIVAVMFSDRHPRLAAEFANSLVAAYVADNFRVRYDAVQQVSGWLSTQMNQLQGDADQAQKDLSNFQQKNNIVGTDIENNSTMDRLKQLNAELTQAEADRISAEAKYRAAESGNPDVLLAISPDAGLQALETQRAQLLVQQGQLASKFGSRYPALVELTAARKRLDAQINTEISRVTERLKEELDAASQTEAMMKDQYTRQTTAAFALNRNVAQYVILRDKEQASRDLYDMLESKLQQASIDAGLASIDTSIVDKASIPAFPAEPRVLLTVMIGTCIGLISGLGAAFLSELMNDTVRDMEGVEAVTGVPALAAIPKFNQKDLAAPEDPPEASSSKAPAWAMVTVRQPQSRNSEAFRALRNAILLSSLDHDLKSILVTSSLPMEGKSTIAANYAVSLAQRSAKVLLMDLDLRRPQQHTFFHLGNRIGLSTWLAGGEPAILKPIPELPSLDFVPSGPKVPSPAEVLSSERVRTLLAELEKEYDYVIIDSAPVLSVSDSVPIASWVDGVLLISRFNSTPAKALFQGVSVLRRANANLRGIILNAVDHRAEGYYYYGEYSGAYYEQA